MEEEKFFVICNSDGDVRIEEFTKDKLIKELNEQAWGEKGFVDSAELKETNGDSNYWGDNILIIRGNIITPKTKEIVLSYTVDD